MNDELSRADVTVVESETPAAGLDHRSNSRCWWEIATTFRSSGPLEGCIIENRATSNWQNESCVNRSVGVLWVVCITGSLGPRPLRDGYCTECASLVARETLQSDRLM